jgi:putative ABC transport system permease protein
VRLVGAFQDYASDTGYLIMGLEPYRRLYADPQLTGISVFLRDPAQAERVRSEILRWGRSEELEIRSQRALKQLSVEIFEQTFQVTRLLQVLAVGVAAVGILGAVAAHRLERRREFALWRCLGLSQREVLGVVWAEAALCGLWAGLAAWPCGLLQGYAMVHFINRRAFGWSLDFHVDPWVLLSTPCLGLLAATLAIVVSSGGGGRPAEDLRQE